MNEKPVYEFRVTWRSGHTEVITATSLTVYPGWVRVIDGSDTVLLAAAEDIRVVRNLSLAPDVIGGQS